MGTRTRDNTRDSASASVRDSARDSTIDRASVSTRELEIIDKFLHPHHLLVHKVQLFYYLLVVECAHHLTCHHHSSCIPF